MKREKIFPNSFYKTNIPLIPKEDRNGASKRNLQINTSHKYYKNS
jgi:hypothetical protein